MGLNFGAFAGGLSQGINAGIDTANKFTNARDQYQLRQLREQGLAEAQQSRQDAINSKISEQASVDGLGSGFTPDEAQKRAAANGIDPAQIKTTYKVGSQVYDDRKQAEDAASKDAPSTEFLFSQKAAPRIRDYYIKMGDIDGAKQWDAFAKAEKGKQEMDSWGKVFGLMQSARVNGDWGSVAEAAGKHMTNFFDTGEKYDSYELIKGNDGQVQGFNVVLKDGDGKTRKAVVGIDQLDDLLMQNNPQARFEQLRAQRAAADKLRTDIAVDNAKTNNEIRKEQAKATYGAQADDWKAGRQQERNIELEQVKGAIATQRITAESKARANATVDLLSSYGYNNDEIKAMIPGILRVTDNSQYAKAPSPEAVRKSIVDNLMINDRKFSGLPPQEQQKIVDQIAGVVMTKPTATPGNPAARGLQTTTPRSSGVVIIDPKTMKPVTPQ